MEPLSEEREAQRKSLQAAGRQWALGTGLAAGMCMYLSRHNWSFVTWMLSN